MKKRFNGHSASLLSAGEARHVGQDKGKNNGEYTDIYFDEIAKGDGGDDGQDDKGIDIQHSVSSF
ncbi:hypothetical protein [Edwardsiella piscicida]|uniref:hypothetical protein n=1 Tax=Edwardsiella piscicida TaxID=1263550 RepID=UPI0035DA1966